MKLQKITGSYGTGSEVISSQMWIRGKQVAVCDEVLMSQGVEGV